MNIYWLYTYHNLVSAFTHAKIKNQQIPFDTMKMWYLYVRWYQFWKDLNDVVNRDKVKSEKTKLRVRVSQVYGDADFDLAKNSYQMALTPKVFVQEIRKS